MSNLYSALRGLNRDKCHVPGTGAFTHKHTCLAACLEGAAEEAKFTQISQLKPEVSLDGLYQTRYIIYIL